jgi:hypothetical protein
MPRPLFALPLACLALGACQRPPTFSEDVAPILARECASCHAEGGIAPFALATFEDAFEHAEEIRASVESREMPPWHINNSGSCQKFPDARELSQAEIDTISAWVDAGALAGDLDAKLPEPEPLERLERVDATIDMGVDYLPDAALTDDYRCFIVDPGIAADAFLTGYEVLAGEPKVVHHMVLFTITSPEGEAEADARDAADPGPGYTCFGGSEVADSNFVTAWAPGVLVQRFPQGTGLKLTGGRRLIMQIHYNTLAGLLPDRTRINLELEDSVNFEGFNFLIGDFDMILPPGEESATTAGSFFISPDILPISVRVHAVFPHMHTLGRTLNVDVNKANGDDLCLADIPNWDFHWQQFYLYEEAARVGPGDTVNIGCSYDTTSRTEPVTFGERTQDEMCLAFLYITL